MFKISFVILKNKLINTTKDTKIKLIFQTIKDYLFLFARGYVNMEM